VGCCQIKTISAVASRDVERREDDEVLASERSRGTFTRRILLGESLDTSRLEADYDRGVLTIMLPVAEQAQPRQAVEAESTES
jgi:HSP20 family protein